MGSDKAAEKAQGSLFILLLGWALLALYRTLGTLYLQLDRFSTFGIWGRRVEVSAEISYGNSSDSEHTPRICHLNNLTACRTGMSQTTFNRSAEGISGGNVVIWDGIEMVELDVGYRLGWKLVEGMTVTFNSILPLLPCLTQFKLTSFKLVSSAVSIAIQVNAGVRAASVFGLARNCALDIEAASLRISGLNIRGFAGLRTTACARETRQMLMDVGVATRVDGIEERAGCVAKMLKAGTTRGGVGSGGDGGLVAPVADGRRRAERPSCLISFSARSMHIAQTASIRWYVVYSLPALSSWAKLARAFGKLKLSATIYSKVPYLTLFLKCIETWLYGRAACTRRRHALTVDCGWNEEGGEHEGARMSWRGCGDVVECADWRWQSVCGRGVDDGAHRGRRQGTGEAARLEMAWVTTAAVDDDGGGGWK
ncbi:hypothetical protein R3P38DRAFT_3598460 [Favolaschia claudopus]|uniref:Uncharacterized protein n=1 Tax=Favolaschia claudopus TaxID=2862362 RepID=A0AAW0ADS0_9AGAR